MQRADKRRYHYIYRITRDDGKYYIGMHSTDDLDDGYFGSGQRISRSIKKHGKGRHVKEILEIVASRAELKAREKELITEELRADAMCMNIAPGGGGGFVNAEHERKFHAAGKIAAKETMRQTINSLTYEQHVAKALKAAETRRRNGTPPAFAGRKHSEETKAKMRAARAKRQNMEVW